MEEMTEKDAVFEVAGELYGNDDDMPWESIWNAWKDRSTKFDRNQLWRFGIYMSSIANLFDKRYGDLFNERS